MNILRLAVCLFISSLACRAQFTATYDFVTGESDVPSVTDVTFSALSITNVDLTYVSANQNVTVNQWVTNGTSANTAEYVSVGLNATAGHQLSLTQFSFKASRTTGGPRSVSVGLYVDGTLQQLSDTFTTLQIGDATTTAMSTHTFDFIDIVSIASTSSAELRIYGWAGTGAAGPLRMDDLTISGSVSASAVPEPSTYAALCGIVALAGAVVRRRLAV